MAAFQQRHAHLLRSLALASANQTAQLACCCDHVEDVLSVSSLGRRTSSALWRRAMSSAVSKGSGSSITGSYVSDVNVAGGQITVKYSGTKANTAITTSTLVLSPISHAGSIAWTCTKSTLKAQYLPSSCRK